MSLILKALKKSEKEREKNAAPEAETPPPPPPEPKPLAPDAGTLSRAIVPAATHMRG